MISRKRFGSESTYMLVAAALAATGCDAVTDMRESVPAYSTVRSTSTSAPRTPSQPPVAQEAPPQPARMLVPAAAPSDEAITEQVKAGLVSDSTLSGTDVSVNTDHGVVHLAGVVKSQEQAAIATTYAQRQDGVMRVDSHLTVAPQ
jgi:hypothetical protein